MLTSDKLIPWVSCLPFCWNLFFYGFCCAAIVYILESPLHQVFLVIDSVTTSEKVKTQIS